MTFAINSLNLRKGALAITALLLAAPQLAAAAGCDDQKGKVIFDDNFADDTGGWPTGNNPGLTTTFGKPDMIATVVAPRTGGEMLNVTFNPKVADYCLQLKTPTPASTRNH